MARESYIPQLRFLLLVAASVGEWLPASFSDLPSKLGSS
jgi:hypothetical protein